MTQMSINPKGYAPNNRASNEAAWHWWLTPAVLASWEAEFRMITVQGQHRQIVLETPSPK
jgi:hypothetical protein